MTPFIAAFVFIFDSPGISQKSGLCIVSPAQFLERFIEGKEWSLDRQRILPLVMEVSGGGKEYRQENASKNGWHFVESLLFEALEYF